MYYIAYKAKSPNILMVRAMKVRKKSQEMAQGIHLLNPTEQEIEMAKEDALAKGFKTVWIHNKRMKKLKKIL